MNYLLDSDVLIDYLNEDAETVRIVREYALRGIALSTVAYMEVLEGELDLRSMSEARSRLATLLGDSVILEVDEAIASICAEIRRILRLRGSRVRPRALDLLIAATAIEYKLTLVTRNRADYHDIPGLTMINI